MHGNHLNEIFANMVTTVPSSVTFRYYHMDHHIYQGVDIIDTDVPCEFELKTFTNYNNIIKIIMDVCQSLAYALRPVFVNPKPLTKWQILNAIIIFFCDYLIYLYCGLWGFLYLLIGSLIGLGLHPAAGHFIAEHYVFVKGYKYKNDYNNNNWYRNDTLSNTPTTYNNNT
eukprot:493033_1